MLLLYGDDPAHANAVRETGPASATMVLEVYGHLMPGSNAEVKAAISRAFHGKPNVIPLRAA